MVPVRGEPRVSSPGECEILDVRPSKSRPELCLSSLLVPHRGPSRNRTLPPHDTYGARVSFMDSAGGHARNRTGVRGFAIRVAHKAINGLAAKEPDFRLQRI